MLTSKPRGDENFRTRPNCTAAKTNHIQKRERAIFLGFELSVSGFNHPSSSSGKVKGRVEITLLQFWPLRPLTELYMYVKCPILLNYGINYFFYLIL